MMYALRSRVRRFAAYEHSMSGFETERGHRVSADDHYRLIRHTSYFAKEISLTKGTSSTRCIRTGPPRVSPQPTSMPSFNPSPGQRKMAFKTHLLPESHDILGQSRSPKKRNRSGTIRRNAHSTNGSALGSTSNTRQALESSGIGP